jgi:xanthosine utilization system XapX-like protein
MAIQTRREAQGRITDLWNRPIEWAHGMSLRLLGWFNQERWGNLFTILALVLANLVILNFMLQGADNRAIAFTILLLLAPLAIIIPEVSIVTLIVIGSGLFVNTFYYAAPGAGTGQRTLLLAFLGIVTARALYEWLRLPASERPRLWTPLTLILGLFWIYYMFHVGYIYLYLYDIPPPDSSEAILGFYSPGVVRYFDGHIIWVGMLPLMILLRNWARARRVIIALGVVMVVSIGAIVWEYFAPMPMFFKVMFQLRAAGESIEGYRIRDPSGLYFSMVGFFAGLYLIGYLRGASKNAILLAYLAMSIFAILATKNRILWGGILLVLPVVLLWKPPHILLRQVSVLTVAFLIGGAALLHPPIYTTAEQIYREALERWSRNYAFAGDPRLDPSYQGRVRERETWEHHTAHLPLAQKLFGAGLEATYGYYISLAATGQYQGDRFKRLYVEKTHIHFAWLGRLLRIGWIGTGLLAVLYGVFFIRAVQIFLRYPYPYMRAIIVGLVGATVGTLFYDVLHTLLHRFEAVPVVLMWAFLELIPHWHRTGQLQELKSDTA